jgi:hypothetical protein
LQTLDLAVKAKAYPDKEAVKVWILKQSTTFVVPMIAMSSVTPKAATKRELLFIYPTL